MDRVINHDLDDAKLCRKSGCSKPCIYRDLIIINKNKLYIFIIASQRVFLYVKAVTKIFISRKKYLKLKTIQKHDIPYPKFKNGWM